MKIQSLATAAVVAATGLAGLAAGLVVIEPGEVGVVRRLGRVLADPLPPGPHWLWPLGIDRLDRVCPAAVSALEIGRPRESTAPRAPGVGEVLTGDLNLLNIAATVQYRIARPVDYIIHAEAVEPILKRLFEASSTQAIARRGVDAALKSDRTLITREVTAELSRQTERLGLGVEILAVGYRDVRPPIEVEAEFAAAQSAASERDNRVAEAQSLALTRAAAAQAAAYAAAQQAQAAANSTIKLAHAHANRFLALTAQHHSNPSLFRRQLFLDAIRNILTQAHTRIISPAQPSFETILLDPTPDSSR